MKKEFVVPFCVVLGLVAGTGGLLLHLQARQQFTPPGVKLLATHVLDETGGVIGTNAIDLPASVLNYRSEVQPVSRVVLGWLPKDTTYGQRKYWAPDGFTAYLSAVLMGTDRTSIHDPQYCLEGQGFQIERTETVRLPVDRPQPYLLPAMKLTLSGKESRPNAQARAVKALYIYWFVAENQLTADHGERMLSMAWELVRSGGLIRPGKLQRWAYITCFAACPPGQEEATYQRLKEFLRAAVPEFQLVCGAPPNMLKDK